MAASTEDLARIAVPRSAANRRPIADYALVGDMRGSALVAGDATIDWLCLRRFDADPVFAGLLDSGIGGACSIDLEGGVVRTARRYRPCTNILETTLHGNGGTVLVTDFMPVRRLPEAGDVGPDTEADHRLVRSIRCIEGEATVRLRIAPCFDWGRRAAAPEVAGRLARYPGENLNAVCSHGLRIDGQALVARAALSCAAPHRGDGGEDQGEDDGGGGNASHLVLVLGEADLGTDGLETVARQLDDTARYWITWQHGCTYRGHDSEIIHRSSLCLKLMTYAPNGAMVAAPTTGLPEVPGGMRNWDYRFVWTRDASFCVSAFLNLGHRREAAEFLRFLHGSCHGGDAVRVMYAVEGELPGERELTHLAGWEDSKPVLVGNAASEQKQHEIYGELLAALNLYLRDHGTEGLCPLLVADLPAFVVRLAEAAIERWTTPDQGIWELRGPARHMLHTKAMCWVAVDRAIRIAPAIGLAVPAHWAVERDAIRADCLERGWNAEVGAYTMEYGGRDLDMSVLRLVLMDLVAADDPRMVATVEALQAQLGQGDLYRRYRFDDGLPGEEGAFVACSFWMAGILARRGERVRSREMLDRLVARANDVGLLAEEMDMGSGAQLGNFPQAFSHMALVHEAIRVGEEG